MSNDRMANYVEVADRIVDFIEKYPEGCLQPQSWNIQDVGDQTFIVYTARAYRHPKDQRPGVGTAWEPYPGKTNFTKDSELMNAETSAFGRALAALGFVGKKGKAKVATKEEVKARQAEPKENGKPAKPATESELNVIRVGFSGAPASHIKTVLGAAGVVFDPEQPLKDVVEELTQEEAQKVITHVERAAA